MSSANHTSEVIRYWWEKAKESIASARREYEASSYNFAMNRLYYAAYYAVSAALFAKGIFFKKHSGVRSALHSEFVKAGSIPAEWGKFYDQLFRDRQEGDYIALTKFKDSYVAEKLSRCQEFLQVIKPLIAEYLT